jgi:hypothetical protein
VHRLSDEIQASDHNAGAPHGSSGGCLPLKRQPYRLSRALIIDFHYFLEFHGGVSDRSLIARWMQDQRQFGENIEACDFGNERKKPTGPVGKVSLSAANREVYGDVQWRGRLPFTSGI